MLSVIAGQLTANSPSAQRKNEKPYQVTETTTPSWPNHKNIGISFNISCGVLGNLEVTTSIGMRSQLGLAKLTSPHEQGGRGVSWDEGWLVHFSPSTTHALKSVLFLPPRKRVVLFWGPRNFLDKMSSLPPKEVFSMWILRRWSSLHIQHLSFRSCIYDGAW